MRKFLNLWAAVLACAVCFTAQAQPPANEQGPWVVRATFQDPRALDLLLRWAAPWQVDRRRKVLVIEVEDAAAWLRMEREGFRLSVDEARTRDTYTPRTKQAGQILGIPGFPCYRTVEETYAAAQQLLARYPNLVRWVDIGDSWQKSRNPGQGYDLNVLQITNRGIPGPKPVLFVQGGLHAREYVTAETVLRFAEFMLAGYGSDPDRTWIIDHHEIHLLPQANPDGRKVAEMASTQMQRKNRDTDFCPAGGTLVGVDLNRNYPFDWGGMGSATDPCSQVFRGPSAGSEPETVAITTYVRSIFPDQRAESPGIDLDTPVPLDAQGVYVDVHSNAARNWFPWGNVDAPAPNGAALQTLARKFAWYNGYYAEQSSDGGAIGGASDDYTFATLGVASLTMELGGSTFFPSCSTYESTIANPVLQSLLFAARVARAPYRLPAGPELHGLTTEAAADRATIRLVADDARYGPSTGSEPAQTIQGVSLFLVPPWQPGAIAVGTFSATDGVLNAAQEAMHLVLEYSVLAAPRQIAYLQATDAAGNQGPVYAVYVGPRLFADGFE